MDSTVKSVVVPYGIYLGLALALVTVFAYTFNLELFTKWWLGVGNFVLMLIIVITTVKKAKKASTANYFSFRDAFTAYFIPVALGLFIATLVSIIIFNIIDPEATTVVKEKTVEAARSMMEKFNAPEADIDSALAEMEKTNQFSALNQLKSYVFQLAFYSVIGLLIALIFREKNPNKA